jgi:proline dehydrogenase
MVSVLGRAVMAVTDRSAVRTLFTDTRPGRALSTRFVAGELLDDAVRVAHAANADGAKVSLDHLGEHVADRIQAVRARDDYLACLDRIAAEGLDANISVKLTQLGLGTDDELAAQSLDALARRAAEIGTSVTIDMEESDYTEATVTLFEKIQAVHGNLGVALQAYLHRTSADLDRVLAAGGHVRLCKGAYAEPPELAVQGKAAVDAAFDALAVRLMASNSVYPAMATHDDARIELIRRLGERRDRGWEFQMLYGVRTALQRELVAAGLRFRVYIPYGEAWYPYLTRRIAERPANLWFFLRATVGR